MKILIINLTDVGGGAAMAAVRLTTTLNNYGIYARLGVENKQSSNQYVFTLPRKKHLFIYKYLIKTIKFVERILSPITKRVPNPFKFSTTNGITHTTNFHSETDINWINNSDFDIINLHWINGVICNKDIAKITKPIIWTMHDSWPCCGAEHHPNIIENDTRWKDGYFRDNKPKTTKGIDLCRKVWSQKKKYLSNKNITFIAPSNWEHDILKSSKLFGNCECSVIPNIIDKTIFYPKNQNNACKLFDIPSDKKVIGFGAAYDIDNPKSMKGSFYLLEALKKLNNPEEFFLIIFGPANDSFTSKITIPYFACGYISNPHLLSSIYSCCDVIINPSLIENLPTICLESLFCGIPVVAFDVGGTSDIIVHKETGFLATPYKSEELVEGIEWCINNLEKLKNNCISKSLNDFDIQKIIMKTIELYSSKIK